MLLSWCLGAVIVLGAYILCKIIYNLTLHPLSHFPGPKLWCSTRLTFAYYLGRGTLHEKIKSLRDTWGPIVRVAPNELSFISGAAWSPITSGGPFNSGFSKNNAIFGSQEFVSIFDNAGPTHSKLHRTLVQTFSGRSLRKKEGLLIQAVDKLVDKLHEHMKAGAPVNMVEWLNFLSFDVTGEFVFNETFNQLDDEKYHPWVELLVSHLRYAVLTTCLRYLAPLDRLVLLIAPPRFTALRRNFLSLSLEKVTRRIQRDRATLTHTDAFEAFAENMPSTVTHDELVGTFTFLIIAGSETTAGVLSGILNYLSNDSSMLKRLQDEIRSVGPSRDSLTATQTARMPYLNAVIKEGLRLCMPIVSALSRVVPPQGARICGEPIPPGTIVGVPPFAANCSELNFEAPYKFWPERWLPREDGTVIAEPEVFRPFGNGGHACVGKTLAWTLMRLALSRLIYEFEFEVIHRTPWLDQRSFMLFEKVPLILKLHASPGKYD